MQGADRSRVGQFKENQETPRFVENENKPSYRPRVIRRRAKHTDLSKITLAEKRRKHPDLSKTKSLLFAQEIRHK